MKARGEKGRREERRGEERRGEEKTIEGTVEKQKTMGKLFLFIDFLTIRNDFQ